MTNHLTVVLVRYCPQVEVQLIATLSHDNIDSVMLPRDKVNYWNVAAFTQRSPFLILIW